jgi:hypothetical protein
VLNTRASINKAVQALNLGIPVVFDDYQPTRPGAGEYPSVCVRVLSDNRQPTRHLGRLTPQTPAGAHQETAVVECEVRTQSQTFNQAAYYAGILRDGLDEQTVARRTWLLDPDTVNPNPAEAGSIRFGVSQLTTLAAEGKPDYKSAFLTWECQVEVPVS